MKKVVTFLLTLLMVFLNVQNATAQSLQNNTLNSVASFSFFGEEASLFTNDVSFYEVSKDLNFVEVNSDDKENTTTVLTSITQANIFTVVNAWLANPIATALHFDGANDYVDATVSVATALPVGNAARSVEFTIKTGQTSIGNIVSWGTQANNGERSSFSVRDGKVGFIGANKDVTGSVTINDNTEHNIAITYDGSNLTGFKFYVDGVLDPGPYTFNQNNSGVSINTLGQNLILGKNASPSNIEYYNGILENVRIWDKELSAAEVSSYAGQTIPTSTANLVAYFNFNEGIPNADNTSLTTVSDLKGNYNGTITNFAKNGTTSNWVNGVVDATAPTFTSATAVDFTENASGVAYTIAATDDSAITYSLGSGNDEVSFTLNGAEVSFVSSPNFETKASYTINVIATDALNNAANQDVVITILDEDEVAPTVVISSSVSGPTETSPIPVIITFSETVTGFDSSDISVSGGTIQNFVGSDATYGFDLVPAGNGTLTVDIAADVAQDGAGNNNTIASQFSIAFNSAPTFTSASTANFTENTDGIAYTAKATDNNSITYSLGVNADESLFTIDGTTGVVRFVSAPNFESPSDSDTNNTYVIELIASDGNASTSQTVTITVTDAFEDAVSVQYPTNGLIGHWIFEGRSQAEAIKDITGNWDDLTFEGTGTTSVISAGLDLNNNGYAQARGFKGQTIESKTLITYVTLQDLSVTAGSAITLDDQVVDNFDAIVFSEQAQYPNQWRAGSSNFSRSTTTEVGVLETQVNQQVQIAVTYNVISPTSMEITMYRNGVLVGSYTDDETSSWPPATAEMLFGVRHTLIPNANGNAGFEARGSLDAIIGRAMIYNRALSAGEIASITGIIDTTPPTVAVSTTSDDPTNTSPIPVTITFSEAVVGFTVNDITVSGATLSDFAIADNITFTVNATPTGVGTVSISIAGATTADAAGVGNTVSNILEIGFDSTAPTFTSATAVDFTENASGVAYTIAATDDSAITYSLGSGNDEASFTLNGAEVSFVSSPNFETKASYTINVIATDALNNAANQDVVITILDEDEVAPTVVISSSVSGPTETSPIPVIITFNETVTGFDSSDISVSGGTIQNFVGSDATYGFDLVPAGNGTLTVDIAADVAQDGAGNNNTIASQFSIEYIEEIIPTLVTNSATGVSLTAATLSGSITDLETKTIVEKGIMISDVNTNPTIPGAATVKYIDLSAGNGISITRTGLSIATQYYFRAYVIDSNGVTHYADVKTFTTSAHIAPALTTSAASGVTLTNAVLEGTITTSGTRTISEKGILLSSINISPILDGADVEKNIDSGSGTIIRTIKTDLTKATTYYFRAFLTVSDGTTFYGDVSTFTTLSSTVATVLTTAVNNLDLTSATFAGNVTSDGDASGGVSERGIVYAIKTANANPEIGGTGVIKNENGSGTGTYSELISGLASGTEYSYRAYAINTEGTAYGNIFTFTTAFAELETTDASNITTTSAMFAGKVLNAGGNTFTEEGVVYSISRINNDPVIGGTGAQRLELEYDNNSYFLGTAIGLNVSTQYAYKAYAISTSGNITYGPLKTFTTDSAFDDQKIGQWDFEGGSTADSTGNWGDLNLGAANITNGKLDVDAGDLVRTTSYSGSAITTKTLVSFAEIQDLNVRSGSIISMDGITTDNFNAIVYAEREANRWMNGSTTFRRTVNLTPGFAETTANIPVMMAITYAETPSGINFITVYRNGVNIGSYFTPGVKSNWTANNVEVLFGARHSNSNAIGGIDALIDKAIIYDRALSPTELNTLYQGSFEKPLVTTTAASSLGITTATLTGNVTSNGGTSITETGFVYSETLENSDPEIGGNEAVKVLSTNGLGVFNESITGLSGGTDYSFRAYAKNDLGTTYGDVLTFKTSNPSAPTVTTNAVTLVTAFEALFSSNVTDDGGADIEDVGVLFAETSINSNPIVTDTNIIKVGAEDVSSFSETVKNLKPNTQYSYKAYADNDTEFGYGSVLTFTTLATTGTVVTNVATSIQETSAVFSGEATDDGGTTITETGIVYALTATNATPEISGTGVTKDDNGSALGSFSESISGLTDGAQYSYRAYVINSEGTAYGDVLTFTTIETPPAGVASITTTAAQVITQNSAVIAGNISSDNGASVTTRGIVYAKTSVSTLPTIGDPEVNNISIGNGIGAFNTNATALRASTSYSFRAYAINSAGTSYGDVATFTTSALETFLPSGLMGHWDFENGSLVDKTGNWSDLTLGTNTTIVNGKLDLNRGSLANSTTYTGATIKEKTLVAYLELQDLSVRAGSALTIDGVSNDNFDGIVFAEKEANKWMAGSSYFKRTSTPLNPGFEETTVGEPIMMAITYTETSNGLAKVKIYRNGILIGNYTKGAIATWSSGNIEVLFGRRHTNPTRGELDALIDEALIFNRPLSANEILTLYQNSINTTTVATTSVHSIGNASGVFGGNVLNDGGDEITDRGIVYAEKATNASPEIGGTGVSKVQISSGTGAFGEKITDFTSSTTYTYRAYAINSRGTVYGEIEEFTTLDIACAITPDYSSVNQQAWRYFHGQYFVAPCDGVILSLSLRSSRANPDIGIRIAEELPGYNREIGFVDNLALSDNSADVNSRSVLDLSSASVNVEQGKVYYFTFRSLAENEPIYYSDDNSYSPRGSILNGYLHDGGDRDLVFEMEFGPKQEVTDDITTFTAGSNNSFADARNWDKGKPGENASVAVKNGVVMTVDQNDVELDDFRLNSGATLDIPEDKEVIVNGDFNTDGSLSLDSNENNSGVLFIKGTTSGTVTYKRGGLLANKWSIISAPVSGQKIVEFAQNEDNDIRVNTNVSPNRYAIGYYDDSLPSNRWQYFNAGTPAADTFEIGRSYSMSRATDGEVTFTGTLEVGNVNQSVTTGRWQAIGNPYTTFLAANKNESSSFLEDNLALLDDLFQGLYIWDNDQEKYVAVTQIDTDNRSIPPGQGFFIRTKSTTNVVFNENKRQLQPSVGNTGFNKSANPEMILSVTNGTAKVSTKIKYFANATRGFDVGYDYGNFGSSQLDVFTHLLEGSEGTDFTIQSLPLKDMNNVRIPVGITAKAGQEITFSLEKISLEEGLNIYLEDKLLDTLTPLSEIEDTYKISISEDTNGIGRFYLTISSKALGNDDFNLKETISIFTTNTNELKIVGISLGGKVSVQLFNTLGKEVGAFRIDNAEVQNTIDLNNFSRGVYFVRLKSDKSSISKKIVLE